MGLEKKLVEVYLDTPCDVQQSHGDSLDLEAGDDEIWRETERICRNEPSFMLQSDFEKRIPRALGRDEPR